MSNSVGFERGFRMEIQEVVKQMSFQAHDTMYFDDDDNTVSAIDLPSQALIIEAGFYLRFPHQQFKITVEEMTDATSGQTQDGK